MKLDIGEMLFQYIQKRRLPQVSIARKMGVSPKTIQYLLKKDSLQCQDVCDMSIALQYNFFKDIAALLPKGLEPISEEEQAQANRIAALEKENEQLQAEIRTLKEAFRILSGR